MPESEYGPFASERDAWATDACAAEHAAWEANPVPGESAKWNMRMLLDGIEEIGLELGAYDLSPLRQVAMYETSKCVALRGIIRRAYEAGKAAGPDGTATEWGVRIAIGTPAEVACPGEKQAGNSVALLRRDHPEFGAVLVTRTSGGPWRLPDEPATGAKGTG